LGTQRDSGVVLSVKCTHNNCGYLVGTSLTHKWIFDLKEDDVYWCTADIGWVTGHSYIVYGPLANGATVVMYEGAPDFPDKDRFWNIVEKYKVTESGFSPPQAAVPSGRAVRRRGFSQESCFTSASFPLCENAW
jgi:acyl-coenzyme A synthetase/AMP-(fatty) acid ligase